VSVIDFALQCGLSRRRDGVKERGREGGRERVSVIEFAIRRQSDKHKGRREGGREGGKEGGYVLGRRP